MKYLLLALLLCGCAAQPEKIYRVNGITIHVAEDMVVWERWAQYRDGMAYGSDYKDVKRPNGFCIPSRQEIWVRWFGDKPDLQTLGHEMYHLMVGDFHKRSK